LPVRKASKLHPHRAWAIYGRAGSGKTTLAGSFPSPVLLLDCRDQGTDSVSDVKGLDVMEVNSWQDFEDAYWWLVQNPGKYKTVVIDTITQLQQIVVEEIAGAKAARKNKVAGDWGTMTKSDWGNLSSRLKTWITNYRDLPMEVVFIAQDRVFNVDEEGSDDGMIDPEVGPRLSPSVMTHLCAAVSIIGNTFLRSRTVKTKVRGRTREKEVAEYCIRLGPSPSYITKFRKPKDITLPSFLIDPTYEDILATIKGDK